MKKAIFAGGCFWCTQAQFEDTEGVIRVVSGYTGGNVPNPTYNQVSTKRTGHAEAIEITYDPAKVTYDALLEIFWQGIDPTDQDGQFFDRGEPYRTAVYYLDDEQKQLAEASKADAEAQLGQKIQTKILPASEFYAAENYHQHYHRKNPVHYNAYKKGSGRERRLKELWGA